MLGLDSAEDVPCEPFGALACKVRVGDGRAYRNVGRVKATPYSDDYIRANTEGLLTGAVAALPPIVAGRK
jgi:hypothetical protein